jgi:hypothetical protein
MTSPNPTVPNANINPGTGQKYDPSNLNEQPQQSGHAKVAGATPAPELKSTLESCVMGARQERQLRLSLGRPRPYHAAGFFRS